MSSATERKVLQVADDKKKDIKRNVEGQAVLLHTYLHINTVCVITLQFLKKMLQCMS
jgi:hypothetical protein